MSARPDLAPTLFEVAAGIPLGLCAERAEDSGLGSRAALEEAILPFLCRPPCVVGFSGGRDSSALLAVAVRLAAREGLEAPLPVSLRFPFPETREASWQELVIGHLGLTSWLRIDCEHELDLIGPLAARGLRRRGVLYPPNVHLIAQLAEHAARGSVLTGVGADDVFGGWPWHRLWSVTAGRARPRLRDARTGAHALAPAGLRREVLRRRAPLLLPWLRGELRRTVAERTAADWAARPRSWNGRMAWLARSRLWRTSAWSAEQQGADQDVMVGSPFIDPAYLAALGREGGRDGWGDRTATMRVHFGDLLPPQLIERRTKAYFSAPYFGPCTHAFAGRWNGERGLDPMGFDPVGLRTVWRSAQPHIGSGMALQSAWLAVEGK